MKKAYIAFVLLFILGWGLRVWIPYNQTRANATDHQRRHDIINLLLDRLDASAETNDGKLPPSLATLGTIVDREGQRVDISNYLYTAKFPLSSGGTRIGEHVVVAENPDKFPVGLFYAGAQDHWITSWANPEFRQLLQKDGLLGERRP